MSIALPVVRRWWHSHNVSEEMSHLCEPYVAEVMRCNVWHLRGRHSDLVVDSGLGLAPLMPNLHTAADTDPVLVLTHTHADHSGGWHEFDRRCVHAAEAPFMEPGTGAPDMTSLMSSDLDPAEVRHMREVGYHVPDCFVTAAPAEGFDPRCLSFTPAPATRRLSEGDVIDLGDFVFEVLHLPGHSPGSIGLFDRRNKVLFSGDAVYDGPLLDELEGSDIDAYHNTMRRLATLDVEVVLPGHGKMFGRDRLRRIALEYLRRRAPTQKGSTT